MDLAADELEASVLYQVAALVAIPRRPFLPAEPPAPEVTQDEEHDEDDDDNDDDGFQAHGKYRLLLVAGESKPVRTPPHLASQ